MYGGGIERFRRAERLARKRAAGGELRGPQELISESIDRVIEALRQWVAKCQRQRGRRPKAYPLLYDMDTKAVAFISLKVVFNKTLAWNRDLDDPPTQQDVVQALGDRLEIEASLKAFRECQAGDGG
jgi:hypothetical protein